MEKLKEVQQVGQSIWLDYIQRGLITSGQLKRLVDSGVSGLTSNPTIFHKAVTQGQDYDEGTRLLREGLALQAAIGVEAYRPLYLTWLGEACAHAGWRDQALDAVTKALDCIDRTGEAFIEAETYRVRGELRRDEDLEGAEGDFLNIT